MSVLSTKSYEGYLYIDHRASPGIPPDIALQMGLDPINCQEGKILESKTLTCAHCKSVVVPNINRTREREKCLKCSGRYLCDGCHFLTTLPDYEHTPFAKKVDVAKDLEARGLSESPLLTI